MQGHMRARWWLRNVIPCHKPQNSGPSTSLSPPEPWAGAGQAGSHPLAFSLMAVVSDKPPLPPPATGCLYNLTFGRL